MSEQPKTPIKILVQNRNIVAVDKPPGISIHNSEDPINLIEVLRQQLNLKDFFPVHRLDKETSGVQIFALNGEAASRYATAFQNHETTKIYFGVVRGQLKKTSGIWAQPLTDKAEGRKNPQGVSAQRIPCQTQFEMTQGSKYFSLCRFQILTGRQHQIRKHTAINGHHLVGDPRYGDDKYNAKIAAMYQQSRLFLHSQQTHLLDLHLESEIPASFQDLLNKS